MCEHGPESHAPRITLYRQQHRQVPFQRQRHSWPTNNRPVWKHAVSPVCMQCMVQPEIRQLCTARRLRPETQGPHECPFVSGCMTTCTRCLPRSPAERHLPQRRSKRGFGQQRVRHLRVAAEAEHPQPWQPREGVPQAVGADAAALLQVQDPAHNRAATPDDTTVRDCHCCLKAENVPVGMGSKVCCMPKSARCLT
jgi:hypothetical protein